MNRLAQYALFLWVFGLVACGGGSSKPSPGFSSSSVSSSERTASSSEVSSSNSSVYSASSDSSLSSSHSTSSSSESSLSSSSSTSFSSDVSSSSTSSEIVSVSSSSSSSIAPLFVVATGVVVDELGVPVSAANIVVEGTNILVATDAEGSFSVDLSVLSPAVLRISKTGFASTIRAAATAGDNDFFAQRIVLHSVGVTLNIEASDENILRVPGTSARVDLPANSLAHADGSAFSGAATVTLTPIDPSVNIEFMPGVMVDSGSGLGIESMGAMGVEFTDANGQPLNLGASKTARIRIPATPPAGVTPPATMPLYHLNEVTGLWEQDGIATLETDSVSGEQYYAGEVTHFSWWNADQEFTRATIDYTQTTSAQCDYSSLPNNVTLVMNGMDFLGRQTLSPKKGEPLYAKALSNARLLLMNEDAILDVLDITMPIAGSSVRLPRCLVMPQQVTLSGKVTVSSGDLSRYRVQISGDRYVTKTVAIDSNGNYSLSVYANSGDVTARLVGGIDNRDNPASSATVSVANSDIAFADLVITDEKVLVSGCINGWETYPHQNAQLNVFKDGALISNLFDVSSQMNSFSFSSTINQSVLLVITPAGDNLREKSIPIEVANIDIQFNDCLPLPKGPSANAVINGSGFNRTLDASTSIEGDANIVKYEWTFSDGAIVEGESINHTFANFGSYFVSLKVTDALQQQSTANNLLINIVDTTQTVDVKPSRLSSGRIHSCFINASAGVSCWGNNSYGQLGNGATDSIGINDATPVIGLNNVVAVSAGERHSCALTSAGALSCWGDNSNGQLGNGSNTQSNTPVAVAGIGAAVVAVSAGTAHTCALTINGAVKCWGSNSAGELGDGTNVSSNIPVDVIGLHGGVHLIAAGRGHSCAATETAGVLCWGSNADGELGNSSTTNSAVPATVTGLTDAVISLSAGDEHSCAVAAGVVKCWGANYAGQLGNGDDNYSSSSVPVAVTGLADIALVVAGSMHSCALNTAGYASCWGSDNFGQLGGDAIGSSNLPVGISTQNAAAEAISLGSYNSCILYADLSVQCWGWAETYEPGG